MQEVSEFEIFLLVFFLLTLSAMLSGIFTHHLVRSRSLSSHPRRLVVCFDRDVYECVLKIFDGIPSQYLIRDVPCAIGTIHGYPCRLVLIRGTSSAAPRLIRDVGSYDIVNTVVLTLGSADSTVDTVGDVVCPDAWICDKQVCTDAGQTWLLSFRAYDWLKIGGTGSSVAFTKSRRPPNSRVCDPRTGSIAVTCDNAGIPLVIMAMIVEPNDLHSLRDLSKLPVQRLSHSLQSLLRNQRMADDGTLVGG